MVTATSTNSFQSQFKFGVKITATSTAQVLQFLVAPDVVGNLVFDIQSVVKLSNDDTIVALHTSDFSDYMLEPLGSGWEEYTVELQEWWLVSAVLTENVAARNDFVTAIFNAALQPSFGYLPNVDTVDFPYSFAMASDTAQVLTDRVFNTHRWYKSDSFPIGATDAVYIPVLETDYGVISFAPTNRLTNNAPPYRVRYEIFNQYGASSVFQLVTTEVDGIIHLPCYPMNINSDPAGIAKPATTPNWRYYTIRLIDDSTNNASATYCFYNAALWGQSDCNYDKMRLGWVNSRGGYDYFNFIKKSEYNNQIERKQYRRVLYRNATDIFLPSDRQLRDRENIVTRNLTMTSDWVQEDEYIFLKNLFFSSQVQIINDDGTVTPVSVVDTAFLERKERNTKKYNVTITVAQSQDYWL